MKVLGSLILALALVESVQGSRGNNIDIKAAGGNGSGGGRMQRKRMMMMAKPQKSGGGSLRASNKKQVPEFMLPNIQIEASQTFVQEQDIIDGSWLLYNIKFEDEVFSDKGSDYKGQVYGFFCKLDLSAQKDDPSQGEYPRLRSTILEADSNDSYMAHRHTPPFFTFQFHSL